MKKVSYALGITIACVAAMLGCSWNLGTFDFNWDLDASTCSPAGPRPANSTPTRDGAGCLSWMCDNGFTQCGGGTACGTDLLHDAYNCGECGNHCASGTCTEGSCYAVTVLTDGLHAAGPIAAGGGYVFVVSGSKLVRVPATGGPPVTMANVIDTAFSPLVAADSSRVYWAAGFSEGTSLRSLATPGGVPTVLDSSIGAAIGPLLVDANYVYWMTAFEARLPGGSVDAGLVEASLPDAHLSDAGRDSGAPDVIGGETSPVEGGDGADARAGWVGHVWRVPKDGGVPEILDTLSRAQGYADDNPIAVSEGRVVFADIANIKVVGAYAATEKLIVRSSPGVSTLAADSMSVYWSAGPSPAFGPGGWSFGQLCAGPPDRCTVLSVDRGNGVEGGARLPSGIFATDWDGTARRTVSTTGGLYGLRAAGGALFGYGEAAVGYATIVRVDVGSGVHTAVAGGGNIGGFAFDGENLYWSRDDKLLATPLCGLKRR